MNLIARLSVALAPMILVACSGSSSGGSKMEDSGPDSPETMGMEDAPQGDAPDAQSDAGTDAPTTTVTNGDGGTKDGEPADALGSNMTDSSDAGCTPTDLRCSGAQTQVCNAAGTWDPPTACLNPGYFCVTTITGTGSGATRVANCQGTPTCVQSSDMFCTVHGSYYCATPTECSML